MTWLKNNRGFLVFMLCFGLFRTAIADYNPIPSGSMRPTLLEGDVVWVNRLAYNVKVPLTDIILAQRAEPQRGEVITFSSPKDGTRLIKRVVGVPGDSIAMRNEVVFINGKALDYSMPTFVQEPLEKGQSTEAIRTQEVLGDHTHSVQFLPQIKAMRNVPSTVIPADQYFVLGDNRDNSADSRYIGLVPRKLLIARAERILVSAAYQENWAPRFERFIQKIQ